MVRTGAKYDCDTFPGNEARDRSEVAEMGLYAIPLNPANVAATADLDSLTRAAGLLGGWSALYSVAVATGRRIPGHRWVASTDAATGRVEGHVVMGDESLPLKLRAYALEFGPALIDPQAIGPPAQVHAGWW